MNNRDLEKELMQLARDVAPGPSLEAAVLRRLEAVPGEDTLPPRLWRHVTTHPMTRMAVAAIIMMALALSVFFWDRTSSLALGDVLGSIDRAGAFSLETRRTRKGRYNDDTVISRTAASEAFGIKVTAWSIDPNTQTQRLSEEGVYSILKGKVTTISHETEMATSIDLNRNSDVVKGLLREMDEMDPRTMLAKILACEYHSIGFSEIEGKTVEGFQTTDPNYFRIRRQPGIIATAWIDTASKLPVCIEETINWIGGGRRYTVSDQFQWGIPLNASDFEVTIPEHFVSLRLDVPAPGPAYDPNSAITGLRYYREKHQRYPETLKKLGPRAVLGPRLPEGLTDEQLREYLRNNKDDLNEMTVGPTDGTIKLYRLLKAEGRDWAYYGDRVTPDMPEAVLWRWSTSEGTYCVMLGDLSFLEVTKEELRALEAKLPN